MSQARAIAGILLSGMVVLTVPASALADGGTVRACVQERGLRVTVFTAPDSPRVGPIDISVLVQDADTGQPVPGVVVHIRAVSRRDPARVIERTATKDEATNKLMVAAVLDVPEAGGWVIQVHLEVGDTPIEIVLDVEVGEALPGWVPWLGWLAWPAGVILLFAAHRMLVRRKSARGERSRSACG